MQIVKFTYTLFALVARIWKDVLMRLFYSSFSRLNTLPEEEQKAREVNAGQWRVTQSGILACEHVSTNLLVAAHNNDTKMGLVGQFPHFSETHPDAQFEAAITAIEDLGDPTRTLVWLGGLTLRENPQAANDRIAAMARIGQRLPEIVSLTHSWLPENRDFMHAQLDAATGTISIEFVSPPEAGGGAAPTFTMAL